MAKGHEGGREASPLEILLKRICAEIKSGAF